MSTLAIPPAARSYVYWVFGVVSLVVGATQVGYAAVDLPAPDWLTVALAVVPFLAAGLGYTAATHTPKVDEYVGEHRAPELGIEFFDEDQER